MRECDGVAAAACMAIEAAAACAGLAPYIASCALAMLEAARKHTSEISATTVDSGAYSAAARLAPTGATCAVGRL